MKKRNWRDIAVGMVVPVLAIAIWQWVASNGWVNPQILPSPLAVWERWVAYLLPLMPYEAYTEGGWWSWAFSGELIVDTLTSLYRVVVGFVIGAGLALPLGLAMGASNTVYAWMNPLVQILRPIPPIAYIPLAILWFGLGNPPAVFLIALGAFFPVLMNTIAGVRQVDGIYLRAARNLGAGGTTMFLRVILPAAVPYILSGVRIGIGTAFIVVIVSEMIAVNNGLGYRILEAREYFWSDKIIAGMITIGLLGLAIDIAMNRLNNYLLRWHRGLEH
ncbi:ABC transporter permease [Massilia sp. Dwa41.01b]|uniref:ABC transporter permease n=1 Tax=unclassified Massilia TaxID=2609279 RepID=UPI001602C271|nr:MULTISPECIES: ABC transporter permease [unclassified Massilia]QNA90428.1 ABC transporter permease [Massilia sp. Dwa41.01b]QNA97656.1 ABC transporter permease [Massilia sp. Se16.2.3]